MKKTAFLMTSIMVSLIILTIFFLAFISSIGENSGNYVSFPEYTRSHTKALCNSEKYCKDYEIFCENENVVGMRFTGAAVQFPENWEDSRDEEVLSKNC